MDTRNELASSAASRGQKMRSLNEARLPLLLLTLLAAILVFLKVLPQDTVLYRAIIRPFQPSPQRLHNEYIAGLRAKDPPLGTRPRQPWSGRPGQPTLAVFVGPCSPCISDSLKKLDALSRSNQSLNVVVISDADLDDIHSFWKQFHLQVPAIADLKGQLSAEYNAAWKPRAYLLDRKGVLRYEQPDQALDMSTVSAAALREVKQ